jgi:predicted signal transduction protein with EAL and GGDEF domain
VNDRLGHDAGDEVLRIVAARIAAVLRPGDVAARQGGDEFAVVLRSPVTSERALAVAQRLIRAVGEPIEVFGRVIHVGATVGIALHPQDAQVPEDLIRRADVALNRAKQERKGTALSWSEDLLDETARHAARAAELRTALARDEIAPLFQPVVSLLDGTVVGVEALARWNHPTRGVVMPAEFIPLAESCGEMPALTRAVVRRACQAAVQMPRHYRVAVNVAPAQIEDPGLVGMLLAELDAAGLEPQRLEIEVTETALVNDTGTARETIAALRRHGMSVALDDFGTGYSNLARLSTLGFDRIKVDRSFVRTLDDGSGDGAIVGAIVALARSLGARVTAEGVERTADARRLAALGCDSAQGYLFAVPMPLDALLHWAPPPDSLPARPAPRPADPPADRRPDQPLRRA